MKQVITKDSSVTFYSEQFGETYHSISGAEEEAVKKFVEPCNIEERAKEQIKILDVCFGLGYNSAAAIDKIREINPNCKISIYALENDPAILDRTKQIESSFKSYNIVQEAAKNLGYTDNIITIKLFLADAREKIKEIQEKFDIIFHDPFSPKKCPELWTEEFFKALYDRSENNGILTTYSCARVVRDNLKRAGYSVENGPIIGRRAPSTIARKGI